MAGFSLISGAGSELCGGVAAPARLVSIPLVEASAAAAVADISRVCGRGDVGGFGDDVGSMSMSMASGSMSSGSVSFCTALLSSFPKACRYVCKSSSISSVTGDVNLLCFFFGFFFGRSSACSLCNLRLIGLLFQ